jgi:hypothetical protein
MRFRSRDDEVRIFVLICLLLKCYAALECPEGLYQFYDKTLLKYVGLLDNLKWKQGNKFN